MHFNMAVNLYVAKRNIAHMKGVNVEWEFIDDDDIAKSRRGRQAHPDVQLFAEILEPVPFGRTIRFTGMVTDTNAGKAVVGSRIRAGAKLAGRKVSIAWHPADHYPQVTVR